MPIFPELLERTQKALARFDSRPIQLDLKGISTFVDNSWYYQRNGFNNLAVLHGNSGPTWSGESVTRESALNHSVVFCCKRILAESCGFLPLAMMQRKGEEKIEAIDHPMHRMLKYGSEEISAQSLRETETGHCALGGNAYMQIMRRSGTGQANELVELMPSAVTPDREKTGAKRRVFVVKDGNSPGKTFTVEKGKPQDILHIPGIGWDGIQGYSVLTLARQSMGTAQAMEKNIGSFFANGARHPYVLMLAKDFADDPSAQKFRDDWTNIYSQPNKAVLAPPWIKEYKDIGVSAVDAQLLENRVFTVQEICRWFRISPHQVGELSRATFSNIEQLALEFVNFTLLPWLTRWEQNLWRCVLTPAEKAQGYYFKHNVNALLRGDFKTRMEGYASALGWGHLNPNEVRDFEDLNPFEGGDEFHFPMNMQALPVGQNSPQLVRIGSSNKTKARLPL